MNHEEARKAAEVMLAYADGAEIEIRDVFAEPDYMRHVNPEFNWRGASDTYRVKPREWYLRPDGTCVPRGQCKSGCVLVREVIE